MNIIEIDQESARNIVEKFHYSKNLPTNVNKNFAVVEYGFILGVACYGPCVSRKAPKEWLELRRLVRIPGSTFILSQFLSKTLKELKKQKVECVLSWADPEQDHHGGIYQATNWIYTEQKSGGNHTFIDWHGKHVHPRTVYARYGTQSVPVILTMFPTWKSFLPKTKHRYMMCLNIKKQDALNRLKTKEKPYPKPDRSC